MCKIQIDDRILSSSKPAKWADVESIISQELSHLSPCTRIVSVTIETTTDNGMAERIENFVKTGTK